MKFSLYNNFLNSSAECVSPRHPDKLADQIADGILDEILKVDPMARVAIEVLGGHGHITIGGEVKTFNLNIVDWHAFIGPIVKRLVTDNVRIHINIEKQSTAIAQGVDLGGAGDQGVMIGYASAETPQLMPLEIVLAREINERCYQSWPFDGKTQVTLQNGRVSAVVASFQNAKTNELSELVTDWLQPVPKISQPSININPCGDWLIGGFSADTGLTGRKITIDNYGPRVPVGGGSFSGKDPTKVDRSGAYMARKIAVDYLRKYGAQEVMVRLTYVIGLPNPVEAIALIDQKLVTIKRKEYDLSIKGIIDFLKLRQPIYEVTARQGHFGVPTYNWER